MNLFLFEIKKIIRTKSLFLILSLTCLLISILFIHNLMKQDLIQSEKLEHFSEISRELSTNILADREYLNEADDPAVSNRIDIGINLQQELSILIDSIRKNDWKQELESEVLVYHLAETYKNVQGDFKITTIEMEKIIKLNEELLISDLPKESERASIQQAVFMKQMISLFINTFGFLIFFVIFLPFLSKEFEDNHMKWLYTTPSSSLSIVST
ncbi:hypothetical protein [Alkalicoccobacillus plakortidis]|uniref:Four helix bundle sensory module for signal transduction n=1 Tax=Alkalicoccobacillus plakortidis TaxID=444060 RepID=A0ABT0XN56_9BACI|nr:hypothetical protein [Alkalicoccobacillus plakortidis]MCM2677330.1 hypothetical protein [Alkalicoccobacillus plakortidis]